MNIKARKLSANAKLPTKTHNNDAGFDLYVVADGAFHINTFERDKYSYVLQPGEVRKFNTGIALELPQNTFMMLKGRSGLAGKGIDVLGGVCDEQYRGEYMVVLANLSNDRIVINEGDRIAQAVLLPLIPAQIEEVSELKETDRGNSGFGSSGA